MQRFLLRAVGGPRNSPRAHVLFRCFALGIAWLPACSQAPPTPRAIDVQGHRGARGLLPENTLPGFRHAMALGVTTLELDVAMTRDGVVVVSHDPVISSRVCLDPRGRRIEEGEGPAIDSLSYTALRAYDCGSLNPDPARFPEPPRRNLPGTLMPPLEQVLALAAEDPGLRFNVEIKTRPGGGAGPPLERFVPAVLAEIRAQGLVDRSTLQCFDWRALQIAKRLEPRLRTVALLAPDTLTPEWLAGLDPGEPPDVLALLRGADAYVDDFSPEWRMLFRHGPGARSVAELQAAGFAVIPWTVNAREDMSRLLDAGVDGIISDYPDRLLAELHERGWEAR
ncbi:MAG: glycerophosphodiester phosphodiesterase family protein [Myxococcota bacterium]